MPKHNETITEQTAPMTTPQDLLTDFDVFLFKQGNHVDLHHKLGAHPATFDGVSGTAFAVWAPNAQQVSVVGDFNEWTPGRHPLTPREDDSGIWKGFIPGIGRGALYKYHVASRHHGYAAAKADPFAFYAETPPKTASVVWELDYAWRDREWMAARHGINNLGAPISIYEVHLGSWRRVPDEGARPLSYREAADQLADYVSDMGYTHVELLPIMEHPFYGSWGYQVTGFFAPTSRYGTPQDFMYLVDTLHGRGIGVILDWVPSHFPSDEHGLAYFDGTHLYEHADPRKGFHPEWNSAIFNYGRNEVRSFLISSALFWLEHYHIDGLRVDAVASMLYLDYARSEGAWIPNEYGGRENLEAIHFLRRLNESVYERHPDVQTIAEESTAWPMVSRPTSVGGLGFGMKWMMGWMHDTLDYFASDPLFRKYRHHLLTFGLLYAFTENFVLPLSHDEVVHGKGSLLGKMPGDEWQRFANLRLLYGMMYGHPGKKLLFMGGEFGQVAEWSHETSLEWHVLQYPLHRGVQQWVRDLNHLHRSEPALSELDFSPDGFEWIDTQDWEQSTISFVRKGRQSNDLLLIVANFTPITREGYRVGVPRGGWWRERLNSDASIYGGGDRGNGGGIHADSTASHGRHHSLLLRIPPLGLLVFKNEDAAGQ
jgi:1,4-alpha-glucan branching enzyme